MFRQVPKLEGAGPGFIRRNDGDTVKFGRGEEAMQLNYGPDPLLCNLQLAYFVGAELQMLFSKCMRMLMNLISFESTSLLSTF